jgi:hypothetical protein
MHTLAAVLSGNLLSSYASKLFHVFTPVFSNFKVHDALCLYVEVDKAQRRFVLCGPVIWFQPLNLVSQIVHPAQSSFRTSADDRSTTDWNNSLKLGFDNRCLRYPERLICHPCGHLLPSRVLEPGQDISPISASAASSTGLPRTCIVAAGTTDSIAAFIGSGASKTGHAVTSLGSTLAIKLLSEEPVVVESSGIYSHRLGVVSCISEAKT